MGRLIKFLSKTLLSLMMMISVVMVGSTDISAIAPDPKIPTAENRVTVDKYAELVPGKVNTWDITLDVKSLDVESKKTKSVLVLDTSGSMQGTKLNNAKTAAKLFVDTVLNEENNAGGNNQVALVTFAGDAVTKVNFTTNADTLKTAIDGLSATGGTFTQAGIRLGNELLAASSADFKNIILLSDGEPTYSYRVKNYVDYSDQVGTGPNAYYVTSKNVPYEEFDEDDRVGTGSSLTQRIGWSDYYYHNGNSAIAEGGFFKALNSGGSHSLYSIALEVSSTGQQILQEIGSPGKYYASNSAGLSDIFKQIAQGITATVKNATIVDPMGQGFEVQGVVSDIQISPNGGTVALNGNTINWDIPVLSEPISAGSDIKYAQIKYRITINDDILNAIPDDEDTYPTNGLTTIQYTDDQGATKTINFPVPKVDPVLLRVTKKLVDENNVVFTDANRSFDFNVANNPFNVTGNIKAGETFVSTALRDVKNAYKVTETNSSDGLFSQYNITYKINGVSTDIFNVTNSTSVTDAMDDIEIEITNQFIPKKIDVSAEKVWINGGNFTRPLVWFKLYRHLGDINQAEAVSVDVKQIPTSPEYKVEWKNLPDTDKFGNKFTYFVREGKLSGSDFVVGPPENYVIKSQADLKITNEFVIPKVDVTGTKIWENGSSLERPIVYFMLYSNLDGNTPIPVVGKEPQQVPTAAPFTVTWSDLPSTDLLGNSINYSIVEGQLVNGVFVEGPPTNYKLNVIDAHTIKNVYEAPLREVEAFKQWQGGESLSRPTVYFKLYRSVLNQAPVAVSTDLAEVKALVSPSTSVKWINLPTTDDSGNVFTYSVKEMRLENGVYVEGAPANYSVNVVDNLVVKNVYTPPNSSVKAHKEWSGGNSLVRPTIWFKLYRAVENEAPVAVDVPLFELTNGNLEATWLNLPITDSSGKAYTYSVKEGTVVDDVFVEGAPTNYSPSIINPLRIKNTYVPTKIRIEAEKIWENGPEQRPDVYFKLVRSTDFSTEDVPGILPKLVPAVPNVDGKYIVDFGEQPQTDNNGVQYTYSVVEGKLVSGVFTQGAPTDYVGSVVGPLVIKNTYTPPVEDVEATKVWSKGDDLVRPTIWFKLYRAIGEETPEAVDVEVKELVDGVVSVTWEDLPTTDIDGNDYTYSIVEGQLVGDVFTEGAPTDYDLEMTGNLEVTNTYIPPLQDFIASKVWVDGENLTRPTIWFKLYRAIGEETPEAVDVEVKELVDGVLSVTWEDLPTTDIDGNDYTYSIVEGQLVGDVFTEGAPDNYNLEMTGNLEVTNTYIPPLQDVIASKVWVDGENLTRPTIWFKLYRAIGEETPEAVDVEVKELVDGVLSVTWEDLPTTDIDGNDYTYSIVEGQLVDDVFKPGTPMDYDLDMIGNLEAENTYIPPLGLVEATKIWDKGDSLERPTIWFKLYRAVGDATPEAVDVAVKELVDGVTSVSWENLPITDIDGNDYIYSIVEGMLDGEVFTPGAPENYTGSVVETLVIKNTYVPPLEDVEATKVWVDGENLTRPTIWFKLYRAIGEETPEAVDVEVKELVDGVTSVTWEGLPTTDIDGYDYTYSIVEGMLVDGVFTPGAPDNYDLDMTGYLEAENTYIPPVEDVEATKVWVKGDDLDRPTIWFKLYRSVLDGELEAVEIEIKVLVDGVTSVTWEKLPTTDIDGNEYTYSIVEGQLEDGVFTEGAPDNYNLEMTGNLEATNTYVPPLGDIEAIKEWVNGNPENRPTVWFKLYRTIETMMPHVVFTAVDLFEEAVEVDIKELALGTEAVVWEELPLTDDHGRPYTYFVREVNEAGEDFVPDNYEKEENGLVVTNTFVPTLGDIEANKVWLDGNSTTRPTIYFKLHRSIEEGELEVVEVEIKELVPGVTSVVWEDLPLTDDFENEYTYSVMEVDAEGEDFVPEFYDKVEEGLTVYNSYVSPTNEIVATKEWVGGEVFDRPTIYFKLYRFVGEEEPEAVEVEIKELAPGVSEVSWEDLPLNNLDGIEYTYFVQEVNAEGEPFVPENYEVSEELSLNLTNTYVTPVIDITVTKVWQGEVDEYPDIEIQLYRNGVAFGLPKVLVDGGTTLVWEDLPLHDELGVNYVYTVDELDVPEGFIRIVNGFTITNVYVELPDTGAVSTQWYTFGGIGAGLAGMLLLITKRKKEDE